MWSLHGVAIVPVAARVAVGVEPVLKVGFLGPLIQNLHVEQMLLANGATQSQEKNTEQALEMYYSLHLHSCGIYRGRMNLISLASTVFFLYS